MKSAARGSRSPLLAEHRARVRAELERARVESLLHEAPVGLLSFLHGDRWARVNRAVMELRGSPIAPRAGIPCIEELRTANGQPVASNALPCSRALSGEYVRHEELAVLRRDGVLIPVLVDAAPVFVGDRVEGIVVSLTDIVARKRVEQLQQDLTALISHDLRGPLNVIAMGTALLDAKLDDPRLRDTTQRLARASAGMRSMIEELLEVGRLESGTVQLNLVPADLSAVVRHTCESVLTPEEAARVVIQGGEPVSAPIDERRFERVVQNLVKNALVFSTEPVEVGVGRLADHAELWVSDRGPGMDAETSAHVFDRFWASTASKRKNGTGLGLYVCRLIAEAHGGECSVDTELGRGSTFRVSIPTG